MYLIILFIYLNIFIPDIKPNSAAICGPVLGGCIQTLLLIYPFKTMDGSIFRMG